MTEAVCNPAGKFGASINKAWSFADMDELRMQCETGGSVEGAAALLYRTFEDVREKAMELGLIK